MSNGLWKCEDCGEIVEQSKAHHCESVPPEPPTLKEKVRAMFDFLDMAPQAIRECHDALSSICETLGLDYRSTEISDIPAAVAALRAELADTRADARRVALIQEYCFARNISWRGLIDDLAARAASGKDASHE